MERKQIINPKTGRKVYADTKLGKQILAEQAKAKQHIPNAVLLEIAKHADTRTKVQLKKTNKLFNEEFKDVKAPIRKTAEFIEYVLKEYPHFTVHLYSSTHHLELRRNEEKFVVIDHGKDKSDVPQIICAFVPRGPIDWATINTHIKNKRTVIATLNKLEKLEVEKSMLLRRVFKRWDQYVDQTDFKTFKNEIITLSRTRGW